MKLLRCACTEEKEDKDDDDDDENCGFCIFMKAGGCKKEFTVGLFFLRPVAIWMWGSLTLRCTAFLRGISCFAYISNEEANVMYMHGRLGASALMQSEVTGTTSLRSAEIQP